jgi:hypothetical protein
MFRRSSIITSLFLLMVFLTGCLSDFTLRMEEKVTEEFFGFFRFLESPDPSDERYISESSVARVLKVSADKMKVLNILDSSFRFRKFWDTDFSENVQEIRYLKAGLRSDRYIRFGDGQCVSAIRSLTNCTLSTYKWIKGYKVMYSAILPGTVIATFDSKGKYWGHVAIYKGMVDGMIDVYDQNWWYNDKSGRVARTQNSFGTHYITGSSGDYDPNNRYNYYIVRVK